MEDVQTIAEIPQDLTGSLGQVLASDVHITIGRRKKKVPELALAIDRQGVNIYNVRQPRLITSYAVSPQAKFTCPPSSIRFRSTTRSPAQRLTFCSLESPKPRLLCFSENLSPELVAGSPVTTSTLDLQSGGSPIVYLEALAADGDDQSNILNTHLLTVKRNGEVVCYRGDLDKEIWSSGAGSTTDRQVLHVKIASVAQLRKGLLKHREDVFALFRETGDEEQSNVLIQITCVVGPNQKSKSTALVLRMVKFNITSDVNGSKGKSFSRLQELVSIDVPEGNYPKKQGSMFELHVASGMLYQQTPNFATVYDLTGLLPRIAYEMELNKAKVTSFLRLSPFSLAISMQSSFSLVGFPYCSIKAASNLSSLTSAEHDPLRLLSYYTSLRTMIAIKGRRLISIRLLDFPSKNGAPRKRKREGTLADSIGRGSYSASRVRSIDYASDHLVKNLGMLLTASEEPDWKPDQTNMGVLSSDEEAIKAFSDTIMHCLEDGTTRMDQQKVSGLLGTFFNVKREPSAADSSLGLELRLLDRDDAFNLLLEKHLLTTDRIEKALKHSGSLLASEKLRVGALVDALGKADPPLEYLTTFAASQISLNLPELAIALVAVIRQWNGKGPLREHKSLANAEPRSKSTQSKNNHHQNPSERIPSPIATVTTTTGASANQLFHRILARLSLLPQLSITSALRTHLTKPDLLHLIDLLRIEIAHAGWLSPYDNDVNDNNSNSSNNNQSLTPPPAFPTPNNQLAHIIHLLNSTIDAIGTAGWILGPGPDPSSSTTTMTTTTTDPISTISHMKAEISAALEGIEEAVYLKGMLGEVLLCGKEALQSSSSSSPSHSRKTKMNGKTATTTTVALQNTSENGGGGGSSSGAALPLGLKLEKHKVPLKKVGAGGELITRSKRDIGRLKSRMVGKYSFERVVV